LLGIAKAQLSALTDLTKNDRDKALMLFSNVVKNPERYCEDALEDEWITDHHEIEMVVEAYIRQFESVIHDIQFLLDQVVFAESNILLNLDIGRNKLLKFNMLINALTCATAIGSFLNGIFGMNLDNGMQTTDNPPLFWIIAAIFFAGLILVLAYLIYWGKRNI
jgi:Mg2+ and Co2+ transporter CorA